MCVCIIHVFAYRYRFKSGTTINFLLYMYDIKLYAKSVQDISLLIHVTQIYCEDIGRSFGLECVAGY